jgi:hypothetical protein
VLPEMELKWDNHVAIPITNTSCSGGSVTFTVPTYYTQVPGSFTEYGEPFTVTGSSDSTYNRGYGVSTQTPTAVTASLPSCGTVGNLGGVLNVMQSHAVKTSLIYRCAGASCALPANASNYSLVGAAVGNDTYFVDKGAGLSVAGIDQGQYPATAPTSASNQYLNTTITAGGGTTTLTLAKNASNSVSSAKTWHDNVPNLYAACQSIPNGGGLVQISAPTALAGNGVAGFPVIANFQAATINPASGGLLFNCGQNLQVSGYIFQRGTIEPGYSSIIGYRKDNPCLANFYAIFANACFSGYANPMMHFDDFVSGNERLQDLVFSPTQPYQSALYWDASIIGNGPVGYRMENVHTMGSNYSYPVVVRAGFGFFWNYGGWGISQSDYAGGRSLLIQASNCGLSAYQNQTPFFPYIFEAHNTYGFGTAEIDNCGTVASFTGNYRIYGQLEEGARGPEWKFDTAPGGVRDMVFDMSAYSDPTGGQGTPAFDFTNSMSSGIEINDYDCATGAQPLLETNPNVNNIFKFKTRPGRGCGVLGVDPTYNSKASYLWEQLDTNSFHMSNFNIHLDNNSGSSIVGAG